MIPVLSDVLPTAAENGTAYAETFSWWHYEDANEPDPEKRAKTAGPWHEYDQHACHITIFNPRFAGIDKVNALAVMAHEVTHCYQQRAIDDPDKWIGAPQWVKEGEATWAMVAAVPLGSKVVEQHWTTYSESPKTPYMDRGYNALGVFAHLSDIAGDPAVWGKLLPVVKASVGGDNDASFSSLIQGSEETYLGTWGSSYFVVGGHHEWTMTGPGHPPQSGIGPQKMSVDAGSGSPIYLMNPYRVEMREINGNADIIALHLFSGWGRAHDDGFGIDLPLDTSGKLALCVKPGGCTCPDGSVGAALITKKATRPISVGLESGGESAQMVVAGLSLDDFCKKPDDPPPPKDPGGGGSGGGGGGDNSPDPHRPNGDSSGDTHLVTFDGLRYDFQAIGEYVLVKSTKDDFMIQTRQVPPKGLRNVSVNQAVATKIGDRRVTIQLENGASILRLDGTPTIDPTVRFSVGSITRTETVYGITYTLEWADGTKARIAQLGGRALNVSVEPSASRAGALAGLLGDDDGSPDNDLVGGAGTKLGLQPIMQELTHGFADAWRIAQANSLFDYQPDQSTATFTDQTFPDGSADADHVPDRATAEKHCREMGITDRRLLDNCIVDIAMTSDFLFASSYSHAQQVLAARAATTPASGHGVLRTVVMGGVVTAPGQRPSGQFDGQAGDVVWVGAPDCEDHHLGAAFDGPGGKGLPGAWPCAIGRRVLPATGTYNMRVYRTDLPIPTGSYYVPIRFVRPDRVKAIAYGDVVFGNIETRGAHDVYTFTAKAGDLLRIAGPGCDIATLVIGVVSSKGAEMLGPSCRRDTDFKVPESGAYKLVVNSADGGSGPYHFVFQGASTR